MDEEREGSELEETRKRNAELEIEVEDLRKRLEQSDGPVIMCGYLYKYRPWARLLEKPWELRFFSLTQQTLTFWKSEAEAANHPRGRILVENWVVHMEGPRNGKYVTFSIGDSSGTTLLRLSEGQEGDGGYSLVHALRSLGCEVVTQGREEHATGSSSISEVDTASEVTQDTTNAKDISSLETDPELRRRRSKLASGPSTGSTVLLQEIFIKNSEAKKVKEASAKREDKSTENTYRPSVPVHKKLRESPLSSDAIFNQSHAGLFNLCIVCLVAVNSRLIIENVMKYGLLIQSGFWFSSKSLSDWPLLMVGLSLPIFPLCSFLVEKSAAHHEVSERIVFFVHVIITTASILYPSYVIHRCNSAIPAGLILTLLAIVGWMKLISYAHTNGDARALAKKGKKVDVPTEASSHIEYPTNLTVSDITYFMVAPTLCYQIGYPRTKTIRKGWVLRQTVKLLTFTGLMGFIVEQYINPTVQNSTHPLKGSYLRALERVLKLSIPTLYVWLCLFYCFFHLWLNILAELLRFGDREFYKDWWNAKTVEEYWRMWNMPVHRWMVRHVYFPCLRAGMPKSVAVIVVFALSGVFHEVCIGIPCHMLRCWAFLGIMFQVPLVFLTNYLQSRFQNLMLGNMVFWFFFCIVGQPMCVLLYYHDVVNHQQSPLPGVRN
ncbi:unnamed protein product [Calypogeia fissa]